MTLCKTNRLSIACAVLLVLSNIVSGCAATIRTASFDVAHPAALDASRAGRTVSLEITSGDDGADAAAEIRADLAQRVSRDADGHLSRSLESAIVGDFAQVILPTTETVTQRFEACSGDARCTLAFDFVLARDLPAAGAALTRVVASYDHAGGSVPANSAQRVAEAFYDRAIVRMHAGDFGRARADLAQAHEIQPSRAWGLHALDVDQMQRDHAVIQQRASVASSVRSAATTAASVRGTASVTSAASDG